MLDILGGGGIGMVAGGINRFLSARSERKAAEERRKAMREEFAHQREMAAMDAEARKEIAAQATRTAAVKSQDAAVRRSSRWVADISAIMRPAITASLMGAFLFYTDKPTLIEYLPSMTSMAVGYWFGDRGATPAKDR